MNVVKLNSLARWVFLPKGKAIQFAAVAGGERRVRLTVNCHVEDALWHRSADGVERLLAVLEPGLNTVEFYAAGPFAVASSSKVDNEIWYQTAEAEKSHVVIKDPVVFTGVPQRRQRNPQLDAIMYVMRQNQRLVEQAEASLSKLEKVKGDIDNARASEKEPVAPKVGKPAGKKPGGVHEQAAPKPAKPRVDAGEENAGSEVEAASVPGEVADE